MDFWVWVVILIIAWALEALSEAAKKRRRQPPVARPRPPSPPRSPRPAAPGPVQRKVYLPEPVPQPPPEGERVVIEVPVKRAPRPRELEATEVLEGVSAEAESAEPQHVRALEKYGPVAEVAAERTVGRRLVVRPSTVREAVIWSEILGRPRGAW